MKETQLLDPPNVDGDELRKWEAFRRKIRNFINRQTFTEYSGQESESRKKFMALTYEEFLSELGLNEEEYILGIRASLKSRGSQAFLQRDPCDVFTNNFNPKLTLLHQANTDVTYIIDEYGKFQL